MNGKFKCPSGRLPGALPLWSVLLLLWPALTFAAEPLLSIDEMENVGERVSALERKVDEIVRILEE